MKEICEKLASLIKNHRAAYGITQVDFSESAGFKNTKKLSEIEQLRNSSISVEEFYGIAHALDRDPGGLAVEIGVPFARVGKN